jgi:hypothetical protein
MLAEDLDQLVLADVQRHGHDFGLGDGNIVDAQPRNAPRPGRAAAGRASVRPRHRRRG